MKRWIFLGMVVSLCLPLAVQAAGIGKTETIGQGKWDIGIDTEFIFDRDLKNFTQGWNGPDSGGTSDENYKVKGEVNKMYRLMTRLNYGLLENLDLYLKLGITDFENKYNIDGDWTWTDGADTATGTLTGSSKIKGENALAYGFGLKGACDLGSDWLIGLDAQYLIHKNKYSASVDLAYSDGDAYNASWKGKMTFQEWQVAPYLAKRIGNFIPYLGAKYSDTRIKDKPKDDIQVPSKRTDKADDNFGLFVGTDCKITENLFLNLEGRFIDETAMSFGCSWKF